MNQPNRFIKAAGTHSTSVPPDFHKDIRTNPNSEPESTGGVNVNSRYGSKQSALKWSSPEGDVLDCFGSTFGFSKHRQTKF